MAVFTSNATGNWDSPLSWSDGTGGYVEFDTTNDETTWYLESNAIDGDIETYSTGSGTNEAEEPLILTLNATITSTKIRIRINGTPIEGDNDALVTIDTSTNGSDWVNVHDGAVPNGVTHGYYEIVFASRTLKAIRIIRNNDDAVYVHEVQAFDVNGSSTYPQSADTVTVQNGHTITLDSATACTTLTIAEGGILTDATNNQGLTVSGVTTIAGTLTCGTAEMSFGSGLTASYSLTLTGTGTFTGGSGNHIIGTINHGNSSNLTLTSGNTTLDSAYSINGNTFAFSSDSVFGHGNGTLIFTRAGTQLLFAGGNTARSFYDVTINNAACVVQFENGNGFHLTIENTLTITAGELDTSDAVSGTSRDLTVVYRTLIAGTLTCNASTVSLGSGLYIMTGVVEVEAGGTFNGGSGTHTIGALSSITATSTCTMTSGTCTFDGSDQGNNLIISADSTFSHNNGTVILTYPADLYIDTQSLYNLTINQSGRTYLSKDLTIENDFTITIGTFDCQEDGGADHDLTIGGNLSNSGTFSAYASLVTLNGTTQALTGSWTFWSFTKTVAAADTLTFDNTGTFTFGGNVTLNGVSGQLLSILSDSAGNAFDFVMPSGAVKTNLEWLSVKDSDASGSHATQKPIAPTDSTDVSGNTDWFSGSTPPPAMVSGAGAFAAKRLIRTSTL